MGVLNEGGGWGMGFVLIDLHIKGPLQVSPLQSPGISCPGGTVSLGQASPRHQNIRKYKKLKKHD